MPMHPYTSTFASMGAEWGITVWDAIPQKQFDIIHQEVVAQCEAFEALYSRFRPTSLLRTLATMEGNIEVPHDLVSMLRLCIVLHRLSGGLFNPLIGSTLEDMGYNEEYSLTPKKVIRNVPDFGSSVHILDDTHIELSRPVLIDIGAVGKGYMVDNIVSFLDGLGLKHFLVNGSGDIFHRGEEPLRAGLEHPDDSTKAIGVLELKNAAFCASGSNRRRWSTYHHIIDPQTLTSPGTILATWVKADSAVLADALATTLFLYDPEVLQAELDFEYCMLDSEYRVKRSEGFTAEMFL